LPGDQANVSLTPRPPALENENLKVELLNDAAFGKAYDITVTVTWLVEDLINHQYIDFIATKTMKLFAVKFDLAIIKRNKQEVPETDEETVGEVISINLDDDDKDAGSGSNPIPDKSDMNGILGEDDFVSLRVSKLEPAELSEMYGIGYRISHSMGRLALWRQDNKTESEDSTLTPPLPRDKETMVYAEGLQSSSSTSSDFVTLKLDYHSTTMCEDKVKLVVAKPIFALFGTGGSGEASLRAYLFSETQDGRVDPYIIKKTTGCYSVFIWKTQPLAKIALSYPGGQVVYDGHSNFGIGLLFNCDSSDTISSFMNVGETLCSISWTYMRNEQGYKNFWIEDSEYGDDITSIEKYDPWKKSRNVVGKTKSLIANEFFETPPTGGGATHLDLDRAQDYNMEKFYDAHYYDGIAADSRRIVAKCGASEMPAKGWDKLFLNSCNSGYYYTRVFNHGKLFYTFDECRSEETTMLFVKAIIDGESDSVILRAINTFEPVNDYMSF